MKSFSLIACSLLLCSCDDMVVTKTDNTSTTARSEVDAKDFDGKKMVRFTTN